MLLDSNNPDLKKRRLSLIENPNSKRFLLLNNFENLCRETGSLTTRKISLMEEKYKTDSNTPKIQKIVINDNNNNNDNNNKHCIYGKQCLYYKKYMKLKKEIDSVINTNSKLNLFNKSLYASLQQKSKDYQYLMKENSILKKAIMKLNGITYNELLKNKIKDFKTNTNILRIKNRKIINYEKIKNNIKYHSSNISKKIKQKEIYKYSNYPTNPNTINDNKKINNYSSISSNNSNSSNNSDNSYFNNIKKKTISYNINKSLTYKNSSKVNNLKNLSSTNKKTFNVENYYTQKSEVISSNKPKIPQFNIKIENNPTKLYDSIQKYNSKRGRSSSIFTIKYSLLSLNIDLYTIMRNNDNMTKLQSLIKSDENFLSLIHNSSENQLLKYSDYISCIINDYQEIIKIGMRMKDFIRSSLLLVDSIISNDTSEVFIDNTCQILNCDRASLFILDQISDSLIVFSGEGLKRAQIKIPKNKGIVGTCFMERQKVRIDDAYNDHRFNKEVDIKTNYRTKSILCYPLIDNDGKCFGVIEAINKFNSPFNDDDEELLKLLSRQACIIFKNAFFNDNNKFYIKKLFSLMSYCSKILHVKNKKEFSEKTEDALLNLYNCVNSYFFFVENEKIIKYIKDNGTMKEYQNDIGIVGKVYKSKEIMAFENIKKSIEFNYIIDLESPSGLLAFPVLTKKTKNVCAIIEVPFAGDINNSGKPKESEINIIKYLSKCIKNWIFKFNNDNI